MDKCKPGFKGKIKGFTNNCSFKQKLLAMGLIKGTEIEVLKVAPMGDPMEIWLRGFHLSIRKSEAKEVIVTT